MMCQDCDGAGCDACFGVGLQVCQWDKCNAVATVEGQMMVCEAHEEPMREEEAASEAWMREWERKSGFDRDTAWELMRQEVGS